MGKRTPKDELRYAVRNYSNLPPMRRALMVEVIEWMDLHTLRTRPISNGLLAHMTGQSVNTVRRGLRELEQAGWLQCLHQGGRFRGDGSVYKGCHPERVLSDHGSHSESERVPQRSQEGATVVPPIPNVERDTRGLRPGSAGAVDRSKFPACPTCARNNGVVPVKDGRWHCGICGKRWAS